MSATLSDIAEKAGVSVSTVSRVLNKQAGKYRISEETQRLIQRTARELNYRPNQLARGLRLKQTNAIGLIAPDVSNPFFAYIIRRAQHVAHAYGYSLVVCNTDEDLDLEIEHLNLLQHKQVDGMIAMPVGLSYSHFEEVRRRGLPLVLVDRCHPGVNASTVVVDNYTGAFEAVEHLIGRGHERIAVIQGLPGTYTNDERIRGYRDALAAHNLPVDDRLIVGSDFRQENGYIETKLLLNMEERPTAIFATGDLISLGAMQAVYEEGLDIPADVSLVMFDDFDFAPFLKYPLTAIQQPKEMMGEMAVKMLVECMRSGRQDVKHIVLKPRLIERHSVGIPSEGRTKPRELVLNIV